MSNIKVGLKFRPLTENEKKSRQWIVSGNQIQSKHLKHKFSFSNVFDESSTNHDVYSFCSPIVKKSLDGFNGTVLTYGQTSSGKTFTMMGSDSERGVIEMAIDDIFYAIDEHNDMSYILRVGFIEIYNEKIYDLLAKMRNEIKIFEYQGQLETNNNEFIVKSKEEIMKYIKIGNRNKHIASTMLNEFSSRSHTIFTISIDSTDSMGETKSSKLIFGDLAGSEKPDVTKESFNEGLHINKSLLALGKIIRELSKPNANVKNVRFRESALTRVLASSLGGNSYTTIVCTASPVSLDETYNTICFAQNAEKAKCKPTANRLNDSIKEISILKTQVQKLQKELELERSRISDNSVINFNTTFEVTTNTVRKTECLKRKFHVDSDEYLSEHPTKIFIQTDMSAVDENKEIIEDLKQQNSELVKENEKLKAELEACNKDLGNLIHTRDSLRNDLKEESHKGWKIKEKCKMLRSKLMQKKEKITSMKAKTSNLIDIHGSLDISCEENNIRGQYESDLVHKNLIIFGLEKEIKKLKEAAACKESQKCTEFASVAVNTEIDVELLEQEICNQQHMMHDLNRKIQELLYVNQVMQANFDETKTRILEITRERDEFRKIISSMKSNFQQSLTNTRRQLHSVIEQKQQQAIDFRRQLTELKNEEFKNHLKMEEHYEKQLNNFKSSNKKLYLKIEYLENELKEKSDELALKMEMMKASMHENEKSYENAKIGFIKSKFDLKLSDTVKFFEKLLDQKNKELDVIQSLRNNQDAKHLVDKLVNVTLR